MFRSVLAVVVAFVVSRPNVASAICAAPPCQRICETAPMSAYYRAEVAVESHVRLLERLGGNPAVDPPVGLLLEATVPGRLAEGSLLLVSVTSPAYDMFDVFDVLVVGHREPGGETVCDGLAFGDYMAIAASDRCEEIAREQDLILTGCDDTPSRQRGCATRHDDSILLGGLALLLVRRRATRGAAARRSASRTTRP